MPPQVSADQVEVVEGPRCVTSEDDIPRTFGQIRNRSSVTLSSLTIEGVFRDPSGALLSVGDDVLFDFAPDTTRNFDISFFHAPDGATGTCEITNIRWDVDD